MSEDLERFKNKILQYSIDQLEDILISLNKEKFPEKYQLVLESLAHKKGEPFIPSPLLQTEPPVQEQATVSLKPSDQDMAPPPVADQETQAMTVEPAALPHDQKEILQEEEKALAPEPVFPQKEAPSESKVSSGKQKEESFQPAGKGGDGVVFGLLTFLVVLTSLMAAYCLLLGSFDLPGKGQLLEIAKKLPSMTTLKFGLESTSGEKKESEKATTKKEPDTPKENPASGETDAKTEKMPEETVTSEKTS